MSTLATEAVQGYLDALEADTRRLAPGEWGLSVEAAGWPLHVGVALRDAPSGAQAGVLRVQAEALAPDRISDHELLHRNRGLRLVRYAHAGDGTVWVQAELPAEAVTAQWLDRVLGAVVAAATVARERATAPR